MAAVEQNPYESECALDEHLVMIIIETIRDDDSLRSKRFRGKFRCFGRAKIGARVQKERGCWGRGEFLFSSPSLSFFALTTATAMRTSDICIF